MLIYKIAIKKIILIKNLTLLDLLYRLWQISILTFCFQQKNDFLLNKKKLDLKYEMVLYKAKNKVLNFDFQFIIFKKTGFLIKKSKINIYVKKKPLLIKYQ